MIGSTLHDCRRSKGDTMRSLASKAGVSHEAVSRIEEGRGEFETLERVASALGFDVRLFIKETGELLLFALDEPDIGKRLRAYREKLLKPTKRCARGELDVRAINAIENRSSRARYSAVQRYAEVLGLTLGLTRRI
ncbi:MAG: helix-turn-helix transcriptional regulator [Hyphomicrobium sp.]|nr:helix-turn-helix transcriptional regulator [Hyphomicrobium sp.]